MTAKPEESGERLWAIRRARKSSSQAATLCRRRIESLLEAAHSRLYAICLTIVKIGRRVIGSRPALIVAEGAVLHDDLVETVVARYRDGPEDAINSMLADRWAGRRIEIDARNCAVVRFGQRHAIPTPVNQLIVALLEAASETPVPPVKEV